MLNESDQEMAHHFGVEKCEPYFELTIKGVSLSLFEHPI
jgi:hypothetical protein